MKSINTLWTKRREFEMLQNFERLLTIWLIKRLMEEVGWENKEETFVINKRTAAILVTEECELIMSLNRTSAYTYWRRKSGMEKLQAMILYYIYI
jgi:hypothetical protein